MTPTRPHQARRYTGTLPSFLWDIVSQILFCNFCVSLLPREPFGPQPLQQRVKLQKESELRSSTYGGYKPAELPVMTQITPHAIVSKK